MLLLNSNKICRQNIKVILLKVFQDEQQCVEIKWLEMEEQREKLASTDSSPLHVYLVLASTQTASFYLYLEDQKIM